MSNVLPNILQMDEYTPPWLGLDRTQYIRLDMNENTQPPPPEVYKEIAELMKKDCVQMYPNYRLILKALSKYTKTKKKEIILTNGSDQAIEIILRSFLSRQSTLLISEPEFPIFTQVAKVIGANISKVKFNSRMEFKLKSFIQKINSDINLIVVINPNNPTGTYVPKKDLKKILNKAKQYNIPVVIDEAYFEFTGQTMINFINTYDNLIIVRTFSKAFAMAGFRLGYIVANAHLIKQFYKVRGPFDVNVFAITAAITQLKNKHYSKSYAKEVITLSKPKLEAFLILNKIKFFKSSANFLLIDIGCKQKFTQFMKKNGILIRPMTSILLPKMVRISVGTLKETEIFIKIFSLYLKSYEPKKLNLQMK